jgi:diguanylate cyclase (GGDEF)-like protein
MGEICDEHTTMCIPLIAHGNTVGVFHLYFANTNAEFDQDIKNLVFTLSEHLGLALANLRLQEKLRSQAMRDSLTGLYNRRYFEDAIDREYYAASQINSILSVIMLDLDHFKRFNDNFGHDAGDFVLKEVSSLFSRAVGDLGIVCRIGGEEFVVVSAKIGVEEALTLSNRIIEDVRELHLSLRGISLGQLGVSVGVATYPDLDVSEKELIKLADTALYKAKERGRAQVVYAGELTKDKSNIVSI